MKSFGEIIREEREKRNLILRHVSANLDIDQAIISKFERGTRKPTKEQVIKFARFYHLDESKLIIAWLSDKVAYEIFREDDIEKVLQVAEEKINYLKSINHEKQ